MPCQKFVGRHSVQDGFRRCMSNNSSKPMDHLVQKAQVAIGNASWKHISSQLLKGNANVEIRRNKSTKAKPSLAFGGYYLTTSVVLPTGEISLCTTSELLCLEFLFGTVVRFGVQVKRLWVGKLKQLEENDNLNVLIDPSDVPYEWIRRPISYSVRLKFDGRVVRLCCLYHRYKFVVNEDGLPLDCFDTTLRTVLTFGRALMGGEDEKTDDDLVSMDDDGNNGTVAITQILPGQLFIHNGMLVRTQRHVDNDVWVLVISRGALRGTTINLDTTYVHQSIINYKNNDN